MNTDYNYSMGPLTKRVNSVYFYWTVLPVLAHLLSWMTGIYGVLLFPILVTVGQYLMFRIHPAVNRPGSWFFTLPITFFIWSKWGPLATSTQLHTILPGVMAYYAGQLLNALFLPLIAKPDQRIIIVNWLAGNVVAATVWVILYNALSPIEPGWQESSLFTVYPIIGLVANGISGFFITKSVVSNQAHR